MTDPRSDRGGAARRIRAWVHSSLLGRGEGDADGDPIASVRALLERLRPATSQQVGGVEVVPLMLTPHSERADLLVPDAIREGALEIRGIGSGVVRKVEARNHGRVDVLVLEGDTLVGCKQNRIVLRSLIVAPGAEVVVPVGCMEQGRWSQKGAKFGSGDLRAEPRMRTSTMKEVSSRRAGGAGAYDQVRLWSQVAERLRSEGLRSSTNDYHAYLAGRRAEAESTLARYEPVPDQVGMLCLRKGRLVGLEVTSHPGTFAALWRRTLPSYVLPTPLPDEDGTLCQETVAWLHALRRGEIRISAGLGAGVDLETSGPGFVGRGLWHHQRLRYLAVFPN